MKSIKKAVCRCTKCNKPFKAYYEGQELLCKSCKADLNEEMLKRLTGESVPKTMTRSNSDAGRSRIRNLDIQTRLLFAEVEAAEARENAVAQTIVCKECGEEFSITVGEKEWFEMKGLCVPRRCSSCRQKRKSEKNRT